MSCTNGWRTTSRDWKKVKLMPSISFSTSTTCRNPEALTYVGWMTYVSGDAPTGAALLRRSLEALPDDPLTEWFLANTLLYGTGETTEAVLLLEGLLQHEDLPEEIAAETQRMLDEASQ